MDQPFTLEVLYNPQCTFSFKISVLEKIGEGWKKRAKNPDLPDVLRQKLQELHGLLRTDTTEKNKSVPKIFKNLSSLRNNFAHRAPIITNIGDSIAPQIPSPDNYSVEIDLQTVLTDFKKYQQSALDDLTLINQHLDEFITRRSSDKRAEFSQARRSCWGSGEVKKPFATIAVGVFALMALLHIFRLTFGWEVTFQGGVVPLWVSGLGVVVAGGLAIMLWHESR